MARSRRRTIKTNNMPNVTIAFDEGVKGWTSEFTFLPDSGLSLNNKFYTFNNGLAWEHNIETAPKNNFYGVQNNTSIEFVFNQNPTIVKNFKTLGYEGLGNWTADIETNIEEGIVPMFIVKEGKNYSWIRGASNSFDTVDFTDGNVGGVGAVQTIDADNYGFAEIPLGLSVGDVIYRTEAGDPTNTPGLVGTVQSITGTSLEITTSGIPEDPTTFTPVTGDFIIYVKDNQIEKSGIIGFYSVVVMTNEDTTDAEIFSVNSNNFTTTI